MDAEQNETLFLLFCPSKALAKLEYILLCSMFIFNTENMEDTELLVFFEVCMVVATLSGLIVLSNKYQTK